MHVGVGWDFSVRRKHTPGEIAARGPCRCDRESLIRKEQLLEAVSQMSIRIWSQSIQSPCFAPREAKAQPAFEEFSVHVPALLICELAE